MRRKPVAHPVDNIADDGAGSRSHHPDAAGQKGQGLFMRGIKQSFGGKSFFAFFQQLEQCTGAGNFHGFDNQLIRRFAGKGGNFSGGNHLKSVFRFNR